MTDAKPAAPARKKVSIPMLMDKMKKGEQPWFAKLEMAPAEEVSGTLHDPQGKPLLNCLVYFRSTVGDLQHMGLKSGSDVAMGNVKTDANGRFSFRVIKGTELNTFSAAPDDFARLSESFGTKRGDIGTFRLSPGQRITGVVLDGGGKPLSGLRVSASSEQPRPECGHSLADLPHKLISFLVAL